ncbi:TetR/AcrR family transcriptional regulator [Actinokineospora pegani]|uniref:TetR/AcrR family transcriptional regulator n=1 Tax=Actinokineospora pegani TaxID=2654637 RepID=UPI0012E9C8D8|nr:TetR/AcrR family transcriptional regulator [Actinokineospora pegani]
MSQQRVEQGFSPPQQARSRASLQKVLAAAEYVLATQGSERFTIAAVAERAEVSVGAIYRRFSSKERLLYAVKDQLLGHLETSVEEALHSAAPELKATIGAFTLALAHTFSRHGRIFPELLDGQSADGRGRGMEALAGIQQAFAAAAHLCTKEIPRPDGPQACAMVARTIIGSCVHRAATSHLWPDGLSWDTWATETTEIALAYLRSPQS